MKTFSSEWSASKNRRKQRKYLAHAPLHRRTSFLAAALSKSLKTKYKKNAVSLRKGDKVKVLRGQHKNTTGVIDTVDRKNVRVTLDTVYTSRRDGTRAHYPIHPSNLQIQELALDDRKRKEKLEGTTTVKKTAKTASKGAKK